MAERNDPCPCGSGHKYKKCCLEKDAGIQAAPKPAQGASIEDRDLPGLIKLLERFASEPLFQAHERLITPDCIVAFQELSRREPDRFQYVSSVVTEASVAQLAREGWGRKVASRLSIAQSRYMEEMASRFLRAYTVLEVFPRDGLLLEDAETGETIRVVERSASKELVPMEKVAARVLRDLSQPTLSHLFRITEVMSNRIRQGNRNVMDLQASDPREALEVSLVREFVRACTLPEPRPQLVDAATGGRMEFVRDRFSVTDPRSLEGWLGSSRELDANPKEEGSFIRFQELAGGVRRSLGQVEYFEFRGKMVLEVHSRSREAANDNRAWLKERAGKWLRFTSRKVENPEDKIEEAAGREDTGLPLELEEILAPDFMEKMYRTHLYHDWANTRIPALGNQTPRQCARIERGEAQVVELVRSYQAQENRLARDQKRKPVDLSWLLGEAGVRGRG